MKEIKNIQIKEINVHKILVIVACCIGFCFLVLFVKEVSKPMCEEGTLIDGECLSCPEGFLLDVKTKKCTKLSNENQDDTKIENNVSSAKTEEEIIADYKEQCQTYSYKDIYRYAEKYTGKYAKFYGKVVQVSYNNDSLNTQILRVNVTKDKYGYYEDTIYVFYVPFSSATRILEDDIVTIYGVLDGLQTYTTVLNSNVTIPRINSTYIEINNVK